MSYQICRHEACHAILAHRFGFKVTSMHLHAAGKSGHCSIDEPNFETADDDTYRCYMLMLLAGVAPDGPRSFSSHSDVDRASGLWKQWQRVRRTAWAPFEHVVRDYVNDAYLELCDNESQRLISELANELLERRILLPNHIEQILGPQKPAARQAPIKPAAQRPASTPPAPPPEPDYAEMASQFRLANHQRDAKLMRVWNSLSLPDRKLVTRGARWPVPPMRYI